VNTDPVPNPSNPSPQPEHSRVAEFMRLLSGCERRLYDFVLAMVGNLADADELMQETKLRLWEQYERFEPGTNFGAWARTVAYYQVLDFRKRPGRAEPHLSLEFFEAIAAEVAERSGELDARQRALEVCLQRLSTSDRNLVVRSYDGATPIKQVADSLGRTVTATYQLLWRIRGKLFRCIQKRLQLEDV
jgi:RNA polymerase sigma-70 factor (ECF subfamily)